MTSPLIPVPELPWETEGAAGGNDYRLFVDHEVQTVRVAVGGRATRLTCQQAIEAGAALLAAADGSTARVIDLGELPEVVHEGSCWSAGQIRIGDSMSSESLVEATLAGLAVLEARAAAKPAHDPAEVDAVIRAVGTDDVDEADAIRILDALAAVRGAR
ncbi:hypothetical protein [Enterococcus hirae]|uniref:hypothetical protein n=1 Tax=Enterococcus hirae TaxID=1354 RepID=UPI00136910E8|nr:hypothetical protein [Enterococcus hirae]NAE18005.1 hypothetical protein [Enterococcus hirae]